MNGADRAAVLTPSDIDRLNADGLNIQWVNVYIGGPRSAGSGWTLEAAQSLRDAGVGNFMPTYVGRQEPWDAPSSFTAEQGIADGDEADILTGSFGFDSPTVICLDVEANTYDAHPDATIAYAAAWCGRVREAGHRAGVYGPPRLLQALRAAGAVDFVWAAYWLTSGDAWLRLSKNFPSLTPLAELAESPECWQFVGDVPLVGGVDLSVARDDFQFATCSLPGGGALEAGSENPTPPSCPEEQAASHTYIVRPGDTLSALAARCGHAGEWPALAQANPQIADPNLIYPGQVLTLPAGWSLG